MNAYSPPECLSGARRTAEKAKSAIEKTFFEVILGSEKMMNRKFEFRNKIAI